MATTTRTEQLLSIGEVARMVGVAASTLRYYEQQGLLPPTVRSNASYRFYDGHAVDRLRFIRAAQTAGFTLDDIRTLLDLDLEESPSCQTEVQCIIQRRLEKVDKKMKELEQVRGALGRALGRCRDSNGECAVIKEIRPNRS